MALTLADLPPELITLIVNALPHDHQKASAINLALTSSHIQQLAEHVLWRKLFILTGQHCKNIWTSLKARPERATSVREIELRARLHYEVGLQKLVRILDRTHNVQRLTIESPACSYEGWRYDGNWQPISREINSLLSRSARVAPNSFAATGPPLQMLKRLEIHSNGDRSRFWRTHETFAGLFQHPCLESLTVSCADITFESDTSLRKFSTPLKHLTLIECNISHTGLSSVLACPRALETLHLGESRAHPWEEAVSIRCDLLAFDKARTRVALQQQAHSLQRLVYRPGSPWLLGDHDDDDVQTVRNDEFNSVFENLSQLRELFIDAELRRHSPLEHGALQAAPQLRKLTVTHNDDTEQGMRFGVRKAHIGMSRIFRLAQRCLTSDTLEQVEVRAMSHNSMGYFCNPFTQLAVRQTVKLLSEKNITFRIFFQRIEENREPPFLHGQVEPANYLLFDSEAHG